MIKKSALFSGLLWLVSFQAAALTAEQVMEEEFDRNRAKIEEIFRDKIQKISARDALPEEMRKLLIMQADEIRNFDSEMLQKKMAMKREHAKKRDELKDKLRKDAQNRAKWLLEDEERFQKTKQERKEAENAVLSEVLEIQGGAKENEQNKAEKALSEKDAAPEQVKAETAAPEQAQPAEPVKSEMPAPEPVEERSPDFEG